MLRSFEWEKGKYPLLLTLWEGADNILLQELSHDTIRPNHVYKISIKPFPNLEQVELSLLTAREHTSSLEAFWWEPWMEDVWEWVYPDLAFFSHFFWFLEYLRGCNQEDRAGFIFYTTEQDWPLQVRILWDTTTKALFDKYLDGDGSLPTFTIRSLISLIRSKIRI